MAASAREVRKARSFLQSRGLNTRDVPPRQFASAARELDVGFTELLRLIAQLQLGGQGQSMIRMELLREEVGA